MKKIKLYILSLLGLVLLSSCSVLSSWFNSEPTQAYIKIDYVDSKLTVNNTTGHDYLLKLVSDEKDVNGINTMKTSTYLDIKQGEHSYSLDLKKVVPEDTAFYTDFDTKSLQANSMYIYTSIIARDDKNVYDIGYKAYSTVEADNSDGEVLFNSNLTDNYFKVEGLNTSSGGVSTTELTTRLMINGSETITIASFHSSKTTTEFPSCDDPNVACDG